MLKHLLSMSLSSLTLSLPLDMPGGCLRQLFLYVTLASNMCSPCEQCVMASKSPGSVTVSEAKPKQARKSMCLDIKLDIVNWHKSFLSSMCSQSSLVHRLSRDKACQGSQDSWRGHHNPDGPNDHQITWADSKWNGTFVKNLSQMTTTQGFTHHCLTFLFYQHTDPLKTAKY